MLLARLTRLFLAAALLAAWQAALQHPVEHVDEFGELVHVHHGHSDEGADSQPLCDLLDSLSACAPGVPLLAFSAAAFAELSESGAHGAPRIAEAPPFLSQGPPASV
jgi:hypothetical protein